MAQLIQCDQCGKTARDDFGWWTLDMRQIVLVLGQTEPPYTFCGLGCVAAYAQEHTDEATRLLRPNSRYRTD